MKKFLPAFFCALLFLISCTTKTPPVQEDQFSKHIRTSEALSPAEEKLKLKIPPGFEIELFASEPDIGKPLNMAFDSRGRMWLTQSWAYPFPDTTGQSQDRITILEDTDRDGKADKFTVFADSLNIPIGIVAVPDGAIAYSIPAIYHFIDTDGDDKVDERKALYKGFQYKDTHGMINNLVRSWDGWVHADHGFANTSVVAGTDGDTITMTSGNTFRFRMDGSRVEFTTTGRVNPYGYGYDELGYTYSTDCHSSPIYQLVRGADYPHFGKKPTGIGFGPALMSHNYGSTALAGLDYYLAEQFPEPYQNSFYIGDVVKCRVYRSTMKMNGTTPEITWEPDFVISEDPWFRPVDVKLGPDGALYIADFYNRIIGHYEVPLDHEGRDRQRGRIWRISYKGAISNDPAINFDTAELKTLIDGLDHRNLPLRIRTADQLVDKYGKKAVPPILEMLGQSSASNRQLVQGLWILYRLNALPDKIIAEAAQSEDPVFQVHALRILFEYPQLNAFLLKASSKTLASSNPHVQRQATMVAAKNPRKENIRTLLSIKHGVPQKDTHLDYTLKQGIRDHFRDKTILTWGLAQRWSEQDARTIAEVMVGVNEKDAARFLVQHLEKYREPSDQTQEYARHVAKYIPSGELDQLVRALQNNANGDQNQEYMYYNSLQQGLAERSMSPSDQTKKWGITLATSFLENQTDPNQQWEVIPHLHQAYNANNWRLTELKYDKDSVPTKVLASGQEGNRDASTIRSPNFTLSSSLGFFLFGDKREAGEFENPSPPTNGVELRLADRDSIIAKILITEDSTPQKVSWSTEAFSGQKAYLAVIDRSTSHNEFTAVGALPAFIGLPTQSPRQSSERQIFAADVARYFRVSALMPSLNQLAQNSKADVLARAASFNAILTIDKDQAMPLISALLENENAPLLLKEKLAYSLSAHSSPETLELLQNHLGQFSYDTQKAIALDMANSSKGIDALLKAAETVAISPRILLEKKLQERLTETISNSQKESFATLTTGINPPGDAIKSLIDDRLAKFRGKRHALEKGQQSYTAFCSACHQIKGEGGNIGPQLDAIGNWGSRALAEKILDPNRNISKAFMNYDIHLKDGSRKMGLFRREEGQLLVFADVAGQEFSIEKTQVKEQKLSPYTLMPDHFGTVMPEEDFNALLAFLLNEK